jgi:hypothetical protein
VAATVRFDGQTESITMTDLMEYRAGTTGSFISVPSGETGIPVNVGAASQNYQVRVGATDITFASMVRSILVSARRAAPNVVYNGSTDTITGVSATMEFSLNNGTSWASVTESNIPRSVFGDTAGTIIIRIAATETVPSSSIASVAVPAVATMTPAGVVLDMRNETVTGVSNTMEFSTNGTSWTAITASPLNITNLISAVNDVTLRIRYRAANGEPASLSANIILSQRPAAPVADVKFDGLTESLTVTDLMEYRAGTTGNFTAVPIGETKVPVTAGSSSQNHQVRVKATDTVFASVTHTVAVPARAVAPNAIYNGYMITGVSNAMEFSLDDGETWTSVTTSNIPRSDFGNAATTVLVRIRATATAPSSGIKAVDVPKAGAAAPTGFELNTHDETVAGVSDLMEFSINGTSWTAITVNPLNIANIIPTENDITLRIRYKAGNGEPTSLAANIILPKRPPAPTSADVRYDGLTESITATDLMEFRVGTTGSFTAVPAGAIKIPVNAGSSTQGHQIRTKATDTMFASATHTVTVPARATAPSTMYDGLADMITGVSNAMEFSLNDGEAWTSITASNIPRSVFGNNAKSVMVRIRATAAAPSSEIRSVAVPNTGDVFPKNLTLNTRDEAVTGVSNLMEFSTDGITWTTITTNSLSISSLIPAATASDAVMLSIRYRETGGNPASFAINILLPRRPVAPAASAVRFDGLTESIVANALMEFRVGTTGSFTAVPPGDTRIPVSISTSSQIYQVRVRATDTAFVSATHTVTVPVRAAAPNAVFNTAQNAITGVSSAMEYSLNNGETWTSVNGANIPRSVFGNAATIVAVRIRATATMPSSIIKSIDVPRA